MSIAGLIDSHMHTPLCKHADGEPEAYADAAHARGLSAIIFTCHCPMPEGFSPAIRMADREFPQYLHMVRRAQESFADRLEVRLGLESDWFPGMEDWLRALHRRADFDFILGSVHYHVSEYRALFADMTVEQTWRAYFSHLADAAESGLFDCISHPDLVKNLDPASWRFERVAGAVAEALDRIRDCGVAIELNTSGRLKSYPEHNPGAEMLQMIAERGIPVVLGSDSHVPERVGDAFDVAVDQLRAAGIRQVTAFKNRQPHTLSLDACPTPC